MADLEAQFEQEMFSIYETALRDLGYNASYFLQMLRDRGGVDTAKHLINQKVSDGYTFLYEKNRLDLTVESLVQRSPWRELFTDTELKIAKKRAP